MIYAVCIWIVFLVACRWSRKRRFMDVFDWAVNEGVVLAPISFSVLMILWLVLSNKPQ